MYLVCFCKKKRVGTTNVPFGKSISFWNLVELLVFVLVVCVIGGLQMDYFCLIPLRSGFVGTICLDM